MRELLIYTDGSVYPNPGGMGGWAFVAIDFYGKDKPYEHRSWKSKTTNNRMELTAAINALGLAERGEFITIVTDSQYVQRCFARNSWHPSKPNGDLGRILMDCKRGRFVEVKFVPGHSGDMWNDRAHELANKARLDGLAYEKERARDQDVMERMIREDRAVRTARAATPAPPAPRVVWAYSNHVIPGRPSSTVETTAIPATTTYNPILWSEAPETVIEF